MQTSIIAAVETSFWYVILRLCSPARELRSSSLSMCTAWARFSCSAFLQARRAVLYSSPTRAALACRSSPYQRRRMEELNEAWYTEKTAPRVDSFSLGWMLATMRKFCNITSPFISETNFFSETKNMDARRIRMEQRAAAKAEAEKKKSKSTNSSEPTKTSDASKKSELTNSSKKSAEPTSKNSDAQKSGEPTALKNSTSAKPSKTSGGNPKNKATVSPKNKSDKKVYRKEDFAALQGLGDSFSSKELSKAIKDMRAEAAKREPARTPGFGRPKGSTQTLFREDFLREFEALPAEFTSRELGIALKAAKRNVCKNVDKPTCGANPRCRWKKKCRQKR